MSAEKLDKFTNREYEYVDMDDTFIGRGFQLNMMREQVNSVIDDINDLLPGTGLQYQIPIANASGDGWDYSSDLTYNGSVLALVGGIISTSDLHVDTIGELTAAGGVTINTELYLPSIGGSGTGTSMVYYNRSTGELTYGDAPAGGGAGDVTKIGTPVDNQIAVWTGDGTLEGDTGLVWDTSTNTMTVASNINASGNIYVTANGQNIGRDAFNNISGTASAGGHLSIYGGGNEMLRMNGVSDNVMIYKALVPSPTKNIDLGTTTLFFDNAYFDRVYIDDTATYIDINTGDMTFTDAVSGTVTLASLIGGAGGGTVTNIATTGPITGGPISTTGTVGITQAATGADGYLSSTDWNTFNNKTTNTGTVTSVGTIAPLIGTITTTGNLSITQANTSTDGYLSSTDWNTFNNKTGSSGTVTEIIASSTPVDGLYLSGGTITASGTIAIAGNISVTSVTGTLPVANGGTGLAIVDTDRILTGNGTAALTAEENLTFDGSTLETTGAITATGEITAYA